jgi:hypothetical protein
MSRSIAVIAVSCALIWWLVGPVFSHEWYDAACCSNKDCAPIPDSDVADLGEGGFYIHSRKEHIAFKDTRQGKDDQYHLCVNQATGARLCFYRKYSGS